jgi:hypothetical protein
VPGQFLLKDVVLLGATGEALVTHRCRTSRAIKVFQRPRLLRHVVTTAKELP